MKKVSTVRKNNVLILLYLLFGLFLFLSLFTFFSYYKYITFTESDLKFHVERLSEADFSKISEEDKEAYEKIVYIPVSFDEIPENCIDGIVAIEDKGFWNNNGIDIKGLGRLGISLVTFGSRGGGSTISQQVIKLSRERFYNRNPIDKYFEMLYATRLNDILSKEEILELYLNNAYFGDYNYGIQAASLSYFHKDVSALDLAECSYVVGMPQSPNTYAPTIGSVEKGKERQQRVLEAMVDAGYISESDSQKAFAEKLF